MSKKTFEIIIYFWTALFTLAFCAIVLPPLLESKDLIGAFAAGFVNPYSTGYSLDAIICALILITWVLYERRKLNIRYGWIAILLTFIPGVATAFGVYLLLRSKQLAVRAHVETTD